MKLQGRRHELTTCITCFNGAIWSFMREECGVTAIEYALLAVLIVVIASGSIVTLGGGVGGMWTKISTLVSAAVSGAL